MNHGSEVIVGKTKELEDSNEQTAEPKLDCVVDTDHDHDDGNEENKNNALCGQEQKQEQEQALPTETVNSTVKSKPRESIGENAVGEKSSLPLEEENIAKESKAEIETVERSEDCYLQVLNQYLQCVRNKESHSTFLQDPVAGPFLSLCLASNSDKVLICVLKVIHVLLKNRDNILRLKELLHFTDALLATSQNEDIQVAIRTKAASFYDIIRNSKKPLGSNLDSSNVGRTDNSNSGSSNPPLNSAKEIQFHINHVLNKERRFVITRALVRIDGIISVAFNPDLRLCIIRARRVSPETLGVAVANLGFDCSLIKKNDSSREIVRIPMKPEVKNTEAETDNNENRESEKPFYFPEEDEEDAGANALALKGFGNNNDSDGGWWDSAKKFARKSLFW